MNIVYKKFNMSLFIEGVVVRLPEEIDLCQTRIVVRDDSRWSHPIILSPPFSSLPKISPPPPPTRSRNRR